MFIEMIVNKAAVVLVSSILLFFIYMINWTFTYNNNFLSYDIVVVFYLLNLFS